ncbi:MAG: HAD family hydrolase [Desulfovibrio sp.]|jgi:D-glycero-D-manno-heptose 1,7-bisphosphate phosphatase|nr:HAD family hydrolase [Desulfovibrio sp.]
MPHKLQRAIFLDRDGTLNLDTGYAHRIEEWVWLPGVPETLARFRADGWLLVVVSNQSGIARGFFTEEDLRDLEAAVTKQLVPYGASIDGWYHCPHLPEITGTCDCRKPAPGLLLRAAREHGIDMASSWVIGDRERDVQAGFSAGCHHAVLLNPGAKISESRNTEQGSLFVLQDLPTACSFIKDGNFTEFRRPHRPGH